MMMFYRALLFFVITFLAVVASVEVQTTTNEFKLCKVKLPFNPVYHSARTTRRVPPPATSEEADSLPTSSYEFFEGYCQPQNIKGYNRYWCNVYNQYGSFFFSGGVDVDNVEC